MVLQYIKQWLDSYNIEAIMNGKKYQIYKGFNFSYKVFNFSYRSQRWIEHFSLKFLHCNASLYIALRSPIDFNSVFWRDKHYDWLVTWWGSEFGPPRSTHNKDRDKEFKACAAWSDEGAIGIFMSFYKILKRTFTNGKSIKVMWLWPIKLHFTWNDNSLCCSKIRDD